MFTLGKLKRNLAKYLSFLTEVTQTLVCDLGQQTVCFPLTI